MNKFSELIKQGVAAFNYKPLAPDKTISCPFCRAYNNIYSMINNTHMTIVDGQYMITGHAVADQKCFDRFLYSDVFANVDVRKYGSPYTFFEKNGYRGHYGAFNNDLVYLLDPIPEGE